MEGDGDEQNSKIPSLPQELIIAILVRLPVKYLLQFKCVSKCWLSLISSHDFVKTHLSFSAKDYTRHRVMLNKFGDSLKHCCVSTLFNESVTTEAFDSDYPLKNPCNVVFMVGSVNGLICFRNALSVLVLWNQSTRKFKQVPTLIMSPEMAQPIYGFGYDEVHDDYKILGFFEYIENGYVDAKIYSLKNDSWTSLDDFQGGVPLYGSAFVNKKLHWATIGGDIISFDLVDEKCGKVQQPCYGEGKFIMKLGALGSDFAMICNYPHPDYQITQDYRTTRADLWIMKEYGVKESWTKLYTIIFPNEPVPTLSCFLSHKGETLLLCKSALMIYNPNDNSIRSPEITDIDGYDQAEVYIESLVCPSLQNERTTQH